MYTLITYYFINMPTKKKAVKKTVKKAVKKPAKKVVKKALSEHRVEPLDKEIVDRGDRIIRDYEKELGDG